MAAKTGDVMFTITPTDYNYMLAMVGGKKAWNVQPKYTIPPSLIKNRINMVIKASPIQRQANGTTVLATRTIATILAELRILMDAVADITIDGYDAGTYYVLLDSEGADIQSVIDETGRIIEYDIGISCWDRYQVAA